jgi:hypothetical protein
MQMIDLKFKMKKKKYLETKSNKEETRFEMKAQTKKESNQSMNLKRVRYESFNRKSRKNVASTRGEGEQKKKRIKGLWEHQRHRGKEQQGNEQSDDREELRVTNGDEREGTIGKESLVRTNSTRRRRDEMACHFIKR